MHQARFDFRTGRESGICRPEISDGDQAACSALNRQRAKEIKVATGPAPSRQSVSADVWAALVASRARDRTVPLIPLQCLGLSRHSDGMRVSQQVEPLKTGAEACPFADKEWGIVYKLFPLFASGGLGRTFDIECNEDDAGFSMTAREAVPAETMEKLMVMHDAGGHPLPSRRGTGEIAPVVSRGVNHVRFMP